MNGFLIRCFIAFLLFSLTAQADWQQRVDYRIEVTLDDQHHELHGALQITYHNASPDTLRRLIFHLWPNAYKSDRTVFCEEQVRHHKTDFYYAAPKQRGFIDSLRFRVSGELLEWSYTDQSEDIAQLDLNQPLDPGDSVVITTPFHVKIPDVFSRMGHKGFSYFISQWYPKPAVYDRQGWHPMHYLDQGEFFSEFGSYDVAITLPADYVLMTTGNILDSTENRWLDELSALPVASDSVRRSVRSPYPEAWKTVHVHEDQIHDFAWFADKRWVVRKEVYRGTGATDSVMVYAAFLPKRSKAWEGATRIASFALHQYGTRVGPYPYRTLKVVEGDLEAGGGMEYPTLALIDAASSSSLSTVIIHEVGHNWFYGMLGSDERRHPWMDESLNTYYERSCESDWRAAAGLKEQPDYDDVSLFYQQSCREDQAIGSAADSFSMVNYVNDIYIKAPLFIADLAAYTGPSLFDTAIKQYFRKYCFRHPDPRDFSESLKESLGDRLPASDWWDRVLESNAPLQLGISAASRQNDSLRLVVRNRSPIDAPAILELHCEDSVASYPVWLRSHRYNVVSLPLAAATNWRSVQLRNLSDFNLRDNYLGRRSPRWFRKGAMIAPGFGIQRSPRYKVFVAPFPSWNKYDGPAVGLLLHNLSFPLSRFQFAGGVQGASHSRHINGVAGVSYSWYAQSSWYKEIRIQADAKTFSYNESDLNLKSPVFSRYFKIAPSLEIRFNTRHPDRQSQLLLRQYNIVEQPFNFVQSPADGLYRPVPSSVTQHYFLAKYSWYNRKTFHPGGFLIQVEGNRQYLKIGLEATKRIDYDLKGKSLYLRVFAGKFIDVATSAANSRYWLNSTYSGKNDYLYDGLYLGRSETSGFAARQLSIQEGGAKLPTLQYISPLGRSGDWLLALNLSSDLPLKQLPVRAYLDIQSVPASARSAPGSSLVSFQAGAELHIFGDILKVYVPLLLSNDYRDYVRSIYGKDRLLKSITFSVQLRSVNWLRLHEQLFTRLVQ